MSILKHQRRLWFLAGAATAGAGVFNLEKEAWQGVASISAHLPTDSDLHVQQGRQEPLFGPHFWSGLIRQWNLGIDAVFKPLIKHLSDRGL